MLSPGVDYLHVPRDPVKNVRYRLELSERARGDRNFQRGIVSICSKDILFYINTFVWQTNPNKTTGEEVGPFITWPFQDRALLSEAPGKEGILWCLENKKDALVIKSRDMGATWVFLLVMDWLCRFHKYHDSLMISKSSKAVDDSSRQSLFGKLRFMHEFLPDWLHDRKNFTDQKLYMGYAGTDSSVTGEASTGKAGVSARASEMFLDEFAQIDEDWEVYYRTAATSKCRIFNSTHMGLGTAFYSLSQNKAIKKIQFHWVQHPDKNKGLYKWDSKNHRPQFLRYNPETDQIELSRTSDYPYPPDYEYNQTGNPVGGPYPEVRSAWYDNEFTRVGENLSEMAKDQDINPEGSVSQFYNPLVIKRLKDEYARAPFWEGELRYDTDTGNPIEFIQTDGGRVKLWLNLRDGWPPVSTYGAGADVSGGTGKTNSCLSVVDGRTGEKVMEFSDPNIDPLEFASFAVAICRAFEDEAGTGAKIGWENHGPGASFGKRVWKDLGYRNVYYATMESSLRQSVSDTPGWRPMGQAKLILHTEYRLALIERRYLNRSAQALDETLAFKHDGKGSVEHSQYKSKDDPSGAAENHGDIVVADALSCKMVIGAKKPLHAPEEKPVVNDRSIYGRMRMRELQEQERW